MNWKEFTAGGIGGTVSLIAGHPMDTVKVLIQNTTGPVRYSALTREVYRCGVTSFFRGMSLPVFSYASVNAVIFGAYTTALDLLHGASDDMGKVALAGGFSGACQLVPNVPVEVIKVRLQKDSSSPQREFRGPIDCLRKTLRSHGIAGLYAGLSSNAARDILGVAFMFTAYESSSRHLKKRLGWSEDATAFVAGGIAGLCSWGGIVPLDVVKTRVQSVARGECSQLALLRQVWARGELSRGMGALLFRAFVVNAITFYVYKLTMDFLNRSQDSGSCE